jgi:hypothetical protein
MADTPRGKPFIQPTFSPVSDIDGISKPADPTQGQSFQDQIPQIRRISWKSSEGVSNLGTTVITVHKPTLVKLITLEPVITPYESGWIDVFWRVANARPVATQLYDPSAGLSMPFRGPFAWLPAAGSYELGAYFWAPSTGTGVYRIYADLHTGLSFEQAEVLMLADACHFAKTVDVVVPAANVLEPLLGPDLHLQFMRYRKILVVNNGANTAFIVFGQDGGAGVQFEVTASTVRQFDPELLGRHTVTAKSVLGTTMQVLAALW